MCVTNNRSHFSIFIIFTPIFSTIKKYFEWKHKISSNSKIFFPLKHIKIINSQIIIKKRLLKSTCYGVFPFPKWCHICWNICFDLKVDNCRFNFFASKDGNRVAHKLANHAFPLESSCLDWYCSLLAFLYCEGWDGIYWYFWCIGLIVCLS